MLNQLVEHLTITEGNWQQVSNMIGKTGVPLTLSVNSSITHYCPEIGNNIAVANQINMSLLALHKFNCCKLQQVEQIDKNPQTCTNLCNNHLTSLHIT